MKTRGYLLATAGGVAALAGGAAQAADLAMKSAPPPPVPVAPSWTGWYVGLNAGAAWQSSSAVYGPAGSSDIGATLGAGSAGGFIGGAQIGYNWQAGRNWVVGLEATIDGLTGKATAPPEFDTSKGNGFEARIDWLSTLQGRVGWLMDPADLLYGTGGVAWGGVKDSTNPNGLGSSSAPFGTKSVSKTKTGWVAGGGIEHMIDSHWSLGLEALYVDLGTSDATSANGKTSKFKNSAAIGQLKLNYKF